MDYIIYILVFLIVRLITASIMLGRAIALENEYQAYMVENKRIKDALSVKDIEIGFATYVLCVWKWTINSGIKKEYKETMIKFEKERK